MHLKADRAHLAIPVERLRQHGFSPGVSFASEGSRFWVAVYDFHAQLVDLSLSLYDDEVRSWTSKGWPTVSLVDSSGEWRHIACVLLDDGNHVYILGIGWAGAYIEGFDRDTGSVKMRFLTTFLN